MRSPRPPERRRRALLRAATLAALAALLATLGCAPAAPTTEELTRVSVGLELHTRPEEGQIKLSWEPLRAAASYTLYWSTGPDVAATRDHSVSGLKKPAYLHSGLTNGKRYYYYVVALGPDGREIGTYAPIGDIPYTYEVRRYDSILAVMPRPNDTFDTLAGEYLGDPAKGWLIREFNDQRTLAPFRAVLVPLKSYEPGGLTDKGYRTVPVLTYHQITRSKPTKMAVLQNQFELQMAYLKRNRYEVITLEQFVDFLEFKGHVPERAVVITFDDGWASTYNIALPILRKHGFKATLFVSTDLIGSSAQALTWSQIKELHQSGVIDIQCHTQSHPNLADPHGRDLKAYLDFLEKEMRGSNEVIKAKIGKDCTYLAYPYGATNHLVVAMARRAGFRAAFTVDRGPNPFFVTNYRVLRSMVYGEYDLKQFAANLESFSNRVLK